MRTININARLIGGSPQLGCIDNGQIIGATWDNRAQELIFTRDTGLKNYNMMLTFESGGVQTDVNLGTGNTFTITNALTQNSVLEVRVSFYDGTTFLYGSVNTLRFMYAAASRIGNVSAETINQYLELLAAAENYSATAVAAAEKAQAAYDALAATDVGKLQTQVTSLNGSLNNLFVGVRNLASSTYITGYGQTLTPKNFVYSWEINSYTAGIRILTGAIVSGINYVYSFKFKKISGTITRVGGHMAAHTASKWFIDGIQQATSYHAGTDYDIDDAEHEIMIYFKAGDLNADRGVYFQPNRSGTASQYSIQVWDINLSQGSVATDWTIPPEDITSRLTKLEAATVALGGTV